MYTPLPDVEDLIIMKAVAHRSRDLSDIESLVEANAKLDVYRILRWVGEFASLRSLSQLAEVLDLSWRANQYIHARSRAFQAI